MAIDFGVMIARNSAMIGSRWLSIIALIRRDQLLKTTLVATASTATSNVSSVVLTGKWLKYYMSSYRGIIRVRNL